MQPQGNTWSAPPSEGALQDWTLFLPLDGRMFGRVKKRLQDPRPISSGPNSDVWKCDIGPSEQSNKYSGPVAVKVVRRYVEGERDQVKALERINARLNQEVITWAGVRCRNTVPLIGVMFFPVHALILPWFDRGSLPIYLHRYPAVNRLKLICDIARGLEHLHLCTPIIVHADLKPENVLINDRGDALITDFGMATFLGEDNWYTPSHLHGGTMHWMAPEIFLGKTDMRSRTGDVYAFGSLSCYIITGRIPDIYKFLSQMIGTTNNSPEPIDKWHKHPELQGPFGGFIAGIIRQCWSLVPENRPPMQSIVKELLDLREKRESLVPRKWN
ncbi:hypothetical protein FRC01_002815 [Tulasnella sp. 417]|nr:hypothetical protein FRC01_002815 [Tulasnella sp. 417]